MPDQLLNHVCSMACSIRCADSCWRAPFSIAGGVIALFVTGLDFSISACRSVRVACSAFVMNGILITTYYNQTGPAGFWKSHGHHRGHVSCGRTAHAADAE